MKRLSPFPRAGQHPAHGKREQLTAAVFDSSGYNANVTDTVAYEGQSANYYSGGSLFVRTNVVNVAAAVTMPSVGAGCSGMICLWAGFRTSAR